MWAVPGLPLKLWRCCYSARPLKQVHHSLKLRNSTHELWPPKPNELDSATFTSSRCLSAPTITLVSTHSSGSSTFSVGWM